MDTGNEMVARHWNGRDYIQLGEIMRDRKKTIGVFTRSARELRWIAMAAPCVTAVWMPNRTDAMSINFGPATNISGDADVLNVGALTYAYDWANANVSVNRVPFSGTLSLTGSGDSNVGFALVLAPTGSNGPAGPIANSPTGYLPSVATNPQNYSSGYKTLLGGGDYDNHTPGTDTFVITINSLTPSHEYALQVWENDARPKAGRYANISGGANTVTLAYSVSNTVGVPGQYTVGGFAASGSSQNFNISGIGIGSNSKGPNTQINLMQLRDVTGVWSGAMSGNWDSTSANFTGGENFTTVSGLVNTVYFADTDGFDNPVTNNAITIQPGGVAIGTTVFQNNTVNYTVTGGDSSGLTGTGSLLKTGTGQLTLQSSNTFSGGINVSAGTLTGSVPGAFGTGNLTINPTGTTGTAADAATVYSNGSLSPSASVVVNTNSATAIGTLVLHGAAPAIATLSGNGTVQLANASGTVLTIGGTNASSAFSGTITDNAPGSLVKTGTGNLALSGSNTYHGSTNVASGTLTVTGINALPATTTLNIAPGASVVISNGSSPMAITIANISGGGVVQLNNNAMVVHAGSLSAVNTMVAAGYANGTWNGTSGFVSSTAAGDTTFLTAIGTIINDDGNGNPLYGTNGMIRSTFDGATPVDGDILVKYTYYGDANLDGQVDSSDYARIDNGFLNKLTGWGNGDFNYDNVVNGSDYTLIDNAFNMQGTSLAAEIAAPNAAATSQIAGASAVVAVPEPTCLTFIAIGSAGLLRRRRR